MCLRNWRAPAGRPLPAGRRGKLSAMNLALRKPMTMPEFLEWESCQEFRYEFDGFQPIAITGGLHGKPGNFFGSDVRSRRPNP
jgi:hypothetical protein